MDEGTTNCRSRADAAFAFVLPYSEEPKRERSKRPGIRRRSRQSCAEQRSEAESGQRARERRKSREERLRLALVQRLSEKRSAANGSCQQRDGEGACEGGYGRLGEARSQTQTPSQRRSSQQGEVEERRLENEDAKTDSQKSPAPRHGEGHPRGVCTF